MCGIIGIVSRPSGRTIPEAAMIISLLDTAIAAKNDIATAASRVSEADALLRGDAGIQLLAGNTDLAAAIISRTEALDTVANAEERRIDALIAESADIDQLTARLSNLRDAIWSIRRDRLRTADAVVRMAGNDATASALCGYLAIQQALSAIDRLEVRGRDSAGIAVLVFDGQLDVSTPELSAVVAQRSKDPLFTNASVRVEGNTLVFVYKAAAEIGELGDNTRAMRDSILVDDLLRAVLSIPGVRTTVIGHTRWASVGIISEPNAHPISGEEIGRTSNALSVAVLNGDVDNHEQLRVEHNLVIADPITTDTKVIPALVDRMRDDHDLPEAFRRTVSLFEGSVAIGLVAADRPETMLLALNGSGQGLCIGLAEDRYVVASEPYGLVEETTTYVRMDGELPADPDRPSSRGQVAILDGSHAGSIDGITLLSYEGAPLTSASPMAADVTTRDIDRGDAPHFLLKEIFEAPQSLHKTLRGRIAEHDGHLSVELGESQFPRRIAAALANGTIRRVRVIGQGTAAVAGRSIAPLLDALTESSLPVEAMTATELSGFAMQHDMSDMLVVAVSQSGTTTDTNRTVDLVAGRGASVISIVNRRGSELTKKSHGVVYTSDGRDVEMSVASTKAFYAQVAAGALLAIAIAEATGRCKAETAQHVLQSLRELPTAMSTVLTSRERIAEAARTYAPSRRYWAVVGNGPNAVAANEVRIKLSELCYKSISCDITEDKKHIDLSCEPMILVCAAGLGDGTTEDVAKEVAIYRAHKAAPIVVASEGETRFDSACAVLHVPVVDQNLAFVLSAMVGHLFGYEAARAIDALARPLREAREAIEHVVERGAQGDFALGRVHDDVSLPMQRFTSLLHDHQYDGNLEASTAVRIVTLLSIVTSPSPLESYQRFSGALATPDVLLDDLVSALTRGIDELTRPIDAIKHQAKTVTVGISRSEEGLMDRPLVRAVMDAGAPRDRITYNSVKVLAALDDAVASVTGFTRYQVDGDVAGRTATIKITDRGGISRDLPSRVEKNTLLVGTKHRIASDQEVLVARGRKDNRTVIFVPEVKGTITTGITLLHVQFHQTLPAQVMKSILQGYDRRYDRLVDWVSETEGSFDDDQLSTMSVEALLIQPVSESANHWRSK